MSSLPIELQEAISEEASQFSEDALKKAVLELSERYRLPQTQYKAHIASKAHRAAYLYTRLPATYAVADSVFKEFTARWEGIPIKSVLDLGAGPGTASWAAADIFPMLEKVTLVERDPELLAMGRKLAKSSPHAALKEANWLLGDLQNASTWGKHDLAVFSYSIGELPLEAALSVLQAAWNLSEAVVIIEPGTPKGFERVRRLREKLLSLGAHLLAPCPNHLLCPMADGNWCHFSQRIQRTSLHRRLKAGSLGHEDEKYSYMIGVIQPATSYTARILRHPVKRPGMTRLELCTEGRLEERTISRKQKEIYKLSQKVIWGDIWE